MDEPKGTPMIRQGTAPTPENPYPSNQIVKEYPNGMIVMTVGRPTEKVLTEYQQAIADAPDDAGLHVHYGLALKGANRRQEAIEQMETAIRLRPDWYFPHTLLAGLLDEAGDYVAALSEKQTALDLALHSKEASDAQSETVLRWGLAESLRKVGRVEEARAQLEQAMTSQRSLVDMHRGSSQLLGQIEASYVEVADEPA